MNILILGSGGREHALAWKIAQSPKLSQLFIAPGNTGTEKIGVNINLSVLDFDGIKELVISKNIEMVIAGPEAPLVNGIHDYFLADDELKNIPFIGPQRDGAKLEGSKEFAKQFMQRHGIPTAKFKTFSIYNIDEGAGYLESLKPPYVLKADGLAAGKGVLIMDNLQDAKEALSAMIKDSKFGDAGAKVVIEEFLNGRELSVFALSDGNTFKLLPAAKDYKRAGDGDTGLNTGGMGAVSPVHFADEALLQKITTRIVKPTFEGLLKEGISYKGILYFGLMDVGGEPYVVEYNVRLGDPEAEAVIPRIESDLLELFHGMGTATLADKPLVITDKAAVTVVMTAGGYPGAYETGKVITGTESVNDSLVFHAGTVKEGNLLVSNGGRVLAITSLGSDLEEALERTYKSIKKIRFEGNYYRKDIGYDLRMKVKTQTLPGAVESL